MARTLIIVGLIMVALGVLWPWFKRLNLGHLPGDIFVRGQSTSFYFPVTSCILVSLIVSLALWLAHRWR
jgi:hypothetical protein